MGVPYMLTTHAFPGLGLNDAFAASVAHLLAARGNLQQDDQPTAEVGACVRHDSFGCMAAQDPSSQLNACSLLHKSSCK